MKEIVYDICSKEFNDKELELQKTMEVIHNKYFQSRLCDYGKYYSSDVVILIEQQLQAYKDKYSDLETDYAKAVENENTLRYTVNKYYDEIQAYKDKKDNSIVFIKEQIKHIEDCLQQKGYNKDGLKGGLGALKMVLNQILNKEER